VTRLLAAGYDLGVSRVEMYGAAMAIEGWMFQVRIKG
jgi:hypothetical protein